MSARCRRPPSKSQDWDSRRLSDCHKARTEFRSSSPQPLTISAALHSDVSYGLHRELRSSFLSHIRGHNLNMNVDRRPHLGNYQRANAHQARNSLQGNRQIVTLVWAQSEQSSSRATVGKRRQSLKCPTPFEKESCRQLPPKHRGSSNSLEGGNSSTTTALLPQTYDRRSRSLVQSNARLDHQKSKMA